MKYLTRAVPYLAALALAALPALASAQSTEFVPLTNSTLFADLGNTPDLAKMLNTIYKMCIGIAAMLAVLKIMQAGIMYMGSDVITEKSAAKKIIGQAIGGLLLVLSPVIVFSIINPDILSLKIGDLGDLSSPSSSAESADPYASASWADSQSSRADASARCTAGGGRTVFTCSPKAGTGSNREVPLAEKCASTEKSTTVCFAAIAATADKTCKDFSSITAIAEGQSCSGANGYTRLNAACCSGAIAGAVCCGKPASAPAPVIRYGWRASLTRADGTGRATQQQGPFTTQQQCQASVSSFMQKNGLVTDGTFQCSCDKPLSQQSGCTF